MDEANAVVKGKASLLFRTVIKLINLSQCMPMSAPKPGRTRLSPWSDPGLQAMVWQLPLRSEPWLSPLVWPSSEPLHFKNYPIITLLEFRLVAVAVTSFRVADMDPI